MLDTEHDEFTRHMTVLCAGWNLPLGDRGEAFWRACRKWPLSDFARAVDAILTESEFDKFPSVAQFKRFRRRATSQQVPNGKQAALVEYVMRNLRLSERQVVSIWNWIVRSWPEPTKDNPDRHGFEFLGVIVPQDEQDPVKFPAHRVLSANVDWQQHLEAGRVAPV